MLFLFTFIYYCCDFALPVFACICVAFLVWFACILVCLYFGVFAFACILFCMYMFVSVVLFIYLFIVLFCSQIDEGAHCELVVRLRVVSARVANGRGCIVNFKYMSKKFL